jgi:hypothetical protein
MIECRAHRKCTGGTLRQKDVRKDLARSVCEEERYRGYCEWERGELREWKTYT